MDGGKRAGDTDLKERRLKRKKAAEKRMKVLGEALGHVDSEDGVLVKVHLYTQSDTESPKSYLKSVLHLFKYTAHIYFADPGWDRPLRIRPLRRSCWRSGWSDQNGSVS